MCSIFTFPEQPKDWDMSFPELHSFCWQMWIWAPLSGWTADAFVTLANANPLIRRNCRVLLSFLLPFFFQGVDQNSLLAYKWSISSCGGRISFSVSLESTWDKHLADKYRLFVVDANFRAGALVMHIGSLWNVRIINRNNQCTLARHVLVHVLRSGQWSFQDAFLSLSHLFFYWFHGFS